MSWLKFLVPALAGVQLVSAQCSAKTTTIKNGASASALGQACRTFTGTIAISTSNTDPIDLSGIEVIKNGGIYSANNPTLESLTANDLTTISGGSFYLDNVTALSTLMFPMLTSVDMLHWNSLAVLYGWTLTAGITTAKSVLLSDTQVSSLEGFNLKTVDTLSINNNNLLQDINMQLGNITGGVIISQNGQSPSVSFPDLAFAVNMTFTGVSSLSMNSLKYVNQTLGVYESSLKKFSVPKLSQVGGLALVNNPQLTTISAPNLELVAGALTVTNDTSLDGTITFPKVNMVRGAVKMVGSFTSVSMPSVTFVQGAFTLVSQKKLGDTCDPFEKLHSSGNLKGHYRCHGSTPTPTSSSGGGGGGGGGGSGTSGGSSTSTGAAPKMDRTTPMVGGVLGLFLAILGML